MCNVERPIFNDDLIRAPDIIGDMCATCTCRIGQLTHVTILLKHVTAHIHLTRNIFRTLLSRPTAHARTHTRIHIRITKSAVRFARHVCDTSVCLTLIPVRDCCIIKYHAPIIFFNLISHPHFSYYHENVIIAYIRAYIKLQF